MSDLRRFAFHRLSVLAGGAAVLALVSQLVSCGGDDSAGASDGGADAVADQTVDGPRADSGNDAGTDSGSDAGMRDSAIDSPADSPGDAGPDAPVLGQFNLILAQTLCHRFEQCCLSTPADWDQTKCVTLFVDPRAGDLLGVPHAAPSFDGGHIAYDPGLASQCLANVAALPCGLVSTTLLNANKSLCLSAVAGTIDGGAVGCTSSYECVPSTFCALPDGGPGTCTSLVGDGGACTAEDQCSYLTNPPPSLYCDSTSHTCQPRVDVDAGCVDNSQCTTNHCAFQGPPHCVDKSVVSDPGVPNGTCDFFTIKDAGGGG